MVGILSGAVTNTPGLGAAQQTYTEITGTTDPTIATAYAVAYPLGVVGVILSLILFRYLFKIDPKKENQRIDDQDESKLTEAHMFSLEVNNPAIIGKKIVELKELIEKEFVISRLVHYSTGELVVPQTDTVLEENDKLLVVTNLKNIDTIEALIGPRIDMNREEWNKLDSLLVSRRSDHQVGNQRTLN